MNFKIVKGNRKMPAKFAKFAAQLELLSMEADSQQEMHDRVKAAQAAFETTSKGCKFHCSKGSADWQGIACCYLYENTQAYILKSFLIAIVISYDN